MPILTKEQFENLAKFDKQPCVSIFIPTGRAGKDVLEEKDRINLKNQWKKASEQLKELGMAQDKVDKMGLPVTGLLDDRDFWRHQSDGLAIFLGEDFSEKLTLPINFEAYTHVGNCFYLKPLVPMFNRDGRFFLLSLQLDNVKLYEATEYSIAEIKIDDIAPSQLEDRVGYDFEERGRNVKAQSSASGTSTVHGYDPGNRDRKNEILRYFRAVDKAVNEVTHKENIPLLVACQDSLFPIYQEASKYKNLHPESVPGNPEADHDSIFGLHAAALDTMSSYFNEQKEEKMKQFSDLNPSRTGTSTTEIIPAVFEGKIDTLFLENREDIWGSYNEEKNSVEIHDEPKAESISLMNLAAVKVLDQNGKVYLVEHEFMPDKNSKMNAVYRY